MKKKLKQTIIKSKLMESLPKVVLGQYMYIAKLINCSLSRAIPVSRI
jgi:hypothetical protein